MRTAQVSALAGLPVAQWCGASALRLGIIPVTPVSLPLGVDPVDCADLRLSRFSDRQVDGWMAVQKAGVLGAKPAAKRFGGGCVEPCFCDAAVVIHKGNVTVAAGTTLQCAGAATQERKSCNHSQCSGQT